MAVPFVCFFKEVIDGGNLVAMPCIPSIRNGRKLILYSSLLLFPSKKGSFTEH